MNSATVTKADEQEAAAFLWALDRDSFAELCGAFARHREAERAKIVAWLNDRQAVSAFYIDHIEAGLVADCIEAGDHLK